MPGPARMRWLGALGVLIALTAGLLIAGGGTGVPSAATAASPTPPPASPAVAGFSHPVIVDEQWPGFEPDVIQSADKTLYTSDPEGTPSISPVWSSRDSGNSYQLVPGNLFMSNKATCVGGGDTDLYTDPGNELYFSDLQPLDNISISRSADGGATWLTNCAGTPNTPVDRMWFAGEGSLNAGNLVLFNDYDATLTGVQPNGAVTGVTSNPTNPSVPLGNQLVETVSTNGSTFLPVVNTNVSGLTGDCAGAAVQNCVTNNEGISGNQVVDPHHSDTTSANVYIAHTTSTGEVGVRISEGKVTLGPAGATPTATWTESPNLVGPLCPGSDPTADGSRSCERNGTPTAANVGEDFATVAQDAAGYLYAVFTSAPADASGNPSAPEQVYVVHSLEPAPADPSKTTWSAPQPVTGTGISAGTNALPWITAGSQGRIDVAYYHSNSTSEGGAYGANALLHGSWSVQMVQSINALDATPTYTTTEVSEGTVKYGSICNQGLNCGLTNPPGDRSLGDYLQVKTAADGGALVSYVYDTSQSGSAGASVGPEAISRQTSGPSLYASVGTVGSDAGIGDPMGSVTDPTGDADFSGLGTRTPASDNLDLTGASLANGTTADGRPALVATIKVKSLADLTTAPAEGGPDGSWLMRWDLVTPGQVGNGHIYYVGMDNNQGAGTQARTPTFFVGDQSTEATQPLILTYPQTTLLSAPDAAYDAVTGTITIKVPLSAVGNPAAGTVLHSITALTATSATPQGPNTEFNQIDATTPFDLVVGAPGTVGATPVAPSSVTTLTGPTTSTTPGTTTTVPSTTTTGTGTTGTGTTTTGTGTTTTSDGSSGGGNGNGNGQGGGHGKGGGHGTSAQGGAEARPTDPDRARQAHHSCPTATGSVGADHVGPLHLGWTRGQARRTLARHAAAGTDGDVFCLYPTGIRAVYGNRDLGAAADRGRIVALLTANHDYSVDGFAAGERLHLGGAQPLVVTRGANRWYVIRVAGAVGLLRVRGGEIQEVGIVAAGLITDRASAARVLRGLD